MCGQSDYEPGSSLRYGVGNVFEAVGKIRPDQDDDEGEQPLRGQRFWIDATDPGDDELTYAVAWNDSDGDRRERWVTEKGIYEGAVRVFGEKVPGSKWFYGSEFKTTEKIGEGRGQIPKGTTILVLSYHPEMYGHEPYRIAPKDRLDAVHLATEEMLSKMTFIGEPGDPVKHIQTPA
jgi:hypothetical protein